MGRNDEYQLGLGDTIPRSELCMIKSLLPNNQMNDQYDNQYSENEEERRSGFRVACSGNSSFFITTNGSVYSCGNNHYGQLGRKSPSRLLMRVLFFPSVRIINVASSFSHSLFLSGFSL